MSTPVPPNTPPSVADTASLGSQVTLDATLGPEQSAPALERLKVTRYDPEQSRDAARARITYWLLALLTLLIVFSFLTLALTSDPVSFDNFKAIIEILLGPIVALVSAATGFYFGAHSAPKVRDE